MTMPLTRLRHDLDRLTRRRAALRLGMVAATFTLCLAGGLAVAFALDYLLDLQPLPRAVALLAIAAAIIVPAASIVKPWLGVTESATDVALDVQRRYSGVGDLVAAMQFQTSEAPTWGSPQLEQAVIGSVDEAGRDLDLLEQFSWKPLPQRAALLGVAAAAIILIASLFPDHTTAFLHRLMLADVPYPTQTVITAVAVNGIPIGFDDGRPIRIAVGAPTTFTASIEGVEPASGRVLLTGDDGGTASIALRRSSSVPQRSDSGSRPAGIPGQATTNDPAFTGTLDAFRQPMTFVVQLGDAETPPRRIDLVPRPTLTLDLLPTPPAYARSNAPSPPPPGVRTAYVLEGSDVAIRIRAGIKPLKQVTLILDAANRGPVSPSHDDATIALQPSDDGRTWKLDPAGTPFENVRKPTAFTITATDRDGLTPAEPVGGSIRLRADHPPRVAASAVVRHVLPTARPRFSYEASDDFGLKSLRAKLTVTRGSGTVEHSIVSLPLGNRAAQEYQGRHDLDLSKLGLAKGDRVVVTVEAEDARGDRPGETATAEPVTLEVTDRAGLLTTLLEADEQSAERLDAIIQQELGIGEER